MIGLDRAAVYVELENAEPDLVILGIRKKFPQAEPKKLAGSTQTFKVDQNNINDIRVTDKFGTTLVRIDFSYPRFFATTNLLPVSTDVEKAMVDDSLVNLIYEISLEKVSKEIIYYDYFELCTQEPVKSFYEYHNILSLFYKSLKREANLKLGTRYEDYDLASDSFFSTGFTFKMNPGWKIRLYNKTIEHNKTHETEKVYGGNIRLEHRITRFLIRKFVGSAKITNIHIKTLEKILSEDIGIILFSYLEKEIYRDIEILDKNIKNFRSSDIPNLIRDFQDFILDEQTVNYVISKNAHKSERQVIRYRKKVKRALYEHQVRGSPRRNNFGNIERLENFIQKILFLNIKVKCNYKERLTFLNV